MVGYILTETEKDSIQQKEFAPNECFYCIVDINGVWYTFITIQQKPIIKDSQYSWVLDLPQGEFVPPPYVPPF